MWIFILLSILFVVALIVDIVHLIKNIALLNRCTYPIDAKVSNYDNQFANQSIPAYQIKYSVGNKEYKKITNRIYLFRNKSNIVRIKVNPDNPNDISVFIKHYIIELGLVALFLFVAINAFITIYISTRRLIV